jgi:hypothetical protein
MKWPEAEPSSEDPRALCSIVHNVFKVIESTPAFHSPPREFGGAYEIRSKEHC